MIEVRNTEIYGKGVFAMESIPKWSKFGCVKSQVNVLDDFALRDHCSNCLKHFENLSCCSKCSIMRYCSTICMENDEPYHKYECAWFKEVLSSVCEETKEVNVPSRSQRFLMRFVSHLEQSCVSSGFPFPDSDLVDNYSLVSFETLHDWNTEVEEIRTMIPNFAPNNSIEDLFRFCGIRKSNSFMMRHVDSGQVYGGQIIELHARINNSCDPNCVSSQDGTDSFLIALRDIKPDEEITVAYCDSTLPRKLRQQYLKSNLYFECKCSLCSSNEFHVPEALRTAKFCSTCGETIYDDKFSCETCGEFIESVDFNQIFIDYSTMNQIDKMNLLKKTQSEFHECHWVNNKLADLITREYCSDPEYTKELPSLLVNFETGLVKGSETISNPFILLLRYEYALALINRHPELYLNGLLVASNYLKLAARLKGVDDELAQKFAVLSQKWSEYLKSISSK